MTGAASPTGWTRALGTRLLAQARGWMGQGAPLFPEQTSDCKGCTAGMLHQGCPTKALGLQMPYNACPKINMGGTMALTHHPGLQIREPKRAIGQLSLEMKNTVVQKKKKKKMYRKQ